MMAVAAVHLDGSIAMLLKQHRTIMWYYVIESLTEKPKLGDEALINAIFLLGSIPKSEIATFAILSGSFYGTDRWT